MVGLQGGVSVSGDVLVPLLHRVRLNGSEWRIVVAVLISSRPVSARELALGLRLDYGFVKRIVRGLVAWRILSATPGGLSVQPDATRWGFRTLHDVQSFRGVRNPARSQNARFSLAHRTSTHNSSVA